MWQSGVSLVTWFQLIVLPLRTSRFQSGLYYRNGTPKRRSLAAFRFPFVAFARSGAVTVWGRVPPSETGGWQRGETVVVERRSSAGGAWRKFRTLSTNGAGMFSARVRTTVTRGWLRARIADGRATSDFFSLTRPREPRICPFTN